MINGTEFRSERMAARRLSKKQIWRIIYLGTLLCIVIAAIAGYLYDPQATKSQILLHVVIALGGLAIILAVGNLIFLVIMGIRGKLGFDAPDVSQSSIDRSSGSGRAPDEGHVDRPSME